MNSIIATILLSASEVTSVIDYPVHWPTLDSVTCTLCMTLIKLFILVFTLEVYFIVCTEFHYKTGIVT